MFARNVCFAAAAWGALIMGMSAQAPVVELLLERVGQRIERYYRQAQNIVFTEKAIVQPIRSDFGADGFARSTESEVRVEAVAFNDGEDSADATVVRQLLKVNGRPPREKDKKDRGACLDSNPLSPEPLSFLLPAHRGKYSFRYVGLGEGKDANALIIDFTLPKSGTPEISEDPEGRAGCFRFSLPVAFKGRVLIDPSSYEVLRIEQHMVGPADMRVGLPLQRKHDLPGVMVIERYDITIRYKVVAFKDPEEALLLPESIETLDMYRGGLESHRRRQVFSEYRRFLTGGRVVK